MKAMMGSAVDPRTFHLLDEIRVLRARVAELEDALARAEAVDVEADDDEDRDEMLIDAQPVLETAGR